MIQTPETPTSVGRQLKDRREALDLTQRALAQSIGVDASTVSLTERDRTEIQRGKRAAWEHALRLKPGAITRAYQDGLPIEPIDETADPPPFDPTDPHERAAWDLGFPEEDRRRVISIIRAVRADERRLQSA